MIMVSKQPTEEAVFLNILKAHEQLSSAFYRLFKAHGLTTLAHYNILRILRGAGPEGLPSLVIAERLVNRVPDITRLLDRLEKLEFVERCRIERDRRLVIIKITKKGLEFLAQMDEPVQQLHHQQLGHLTPTELTELDRLLIKARKATSEN